VAPLITKRTRAVIPVHLYGIPAPVDGLTVLCRAHGLHLLEDAAQAHGALHKQQRCGAVGTAGCFSFYPSKNLGALGDGGAIVTSDSELAKRLRRLRNYGSADKYRLVEEGWNSRLDELQAALLRVKLARLDQTNALRVALAGEYRKQLTGVPGVVLPQALPGDEPVWHLFPIKVRERDCLQAHLAAVGIQTAIHYPIPVYRMAPFRSYGPGTKTASDRLAAEVLSLPFWPTMASAAVARVCDEIRAFMAG
jgi:dTDP-3-amino-3,4,6-trideoxy-alpha-D-glucose transaminase